jgi:hypothetical protein
MPWSLIFHYKDLHEERNVKLEGINFLKYHFINSLKESHTLRLGSSNEILSNLSKKDESRMIEGIMKHNFKSFWEINSNLRDKHLRDLKKYAIRVFCNKHHTYFQLSVDNKH